MGGTAGVAVVDWERLDVTVILGRDPEPADPDPALAAALIRLLATKYCPDYIRHAAIPWLASRSNRPTT